MSWVIAGAAILLSVVGAVTWAMAGPGSLRWRFHRDVQRRLREVAADAGVTLTPGDLATLPAPVRRYLEAAGVVGMPVPRAYRLTFTGRIRGGDREPWMPFRAEQYSEVAGPVRLFYMQAWRSGVPVAVFHRYVAGHATMTVRLAGLVPLVNAAGPVMDQSETVTVFNDMCLLAPGTLLDPRIVWRERDAHAVEATFSVGSQLIRATLTFGDDGLVVNFVSPDRSRASADGKQFTALPFLTPVTTYQRCGALTLAHAAKAQWQLPDGHLLTYGEFTLESAVFIPSPR